MRMVYYAIGGGLGHLVRAQAFLRTIGHADTAIVLTASDFARDARVGAGVEMLIAPKSLEHDAAALRRWLMRELERIGADCLCVDAFPAGILGELCDLPAGLVPDFWHVARLLRWEEYAQVMRGAVPRYEHVWRVEELTEPHQRFLDRHCDRCADIELVDAPCVAAEVDVCEPFWLIVHSGPHAEVSELVAYADEIRSMEGVAVPLWLASLEPPVHLPPGTRMLDAYPAAAYFPHAQRIFSAAGFNVMRQTAPYRDKHAVLPMPRRFDDQFERARRAFGARRDGFPLSMREVARSAG